MSFGLEIGRWVGGTKQEIDELNRSIILELFTSVILDTPVLEGRLRGNWLITSGRPGTGTELLYARCGKSFRGGQRTA